MREFLGYLDLVEEELTRPDQEIPDLLTAGKGMKVDDWEITKVLGKGSTARALLLAKDGEERVYKVALSDAGRARLAHEAAQLRRLRDSHIVRLIDGPVDDRRADSPGSRSGRRADRRRVSAQEGRFPIGDLESLGSQLFQVVEYLEAKGIWHRDIKPDNLAIAPAPEEGPPPRPVRLFARRYPASRHRCRNSAIPGSVPGYRPAGPSTTRPPNVMRRRDAARDGQRGAASWGDGMGEAGLLDPSEQRPS